MKYFFLVYMIFIFNGCSSKNAFSEFNLTKEQELSVSNLKSIEIKNENGIFSAIYLDEIDKKRFSDGEYFYVELYTKDNLNQIKSKLSLNGEKTTTIKELNYNNEYSKYVTIHNRWKKYFIVKFPIKIEEGELKLIYNNSQTLIYKKENI